MIDARRFVFGNFTLDKDRSIITFYYHIDLKKGGRETYTDVVEFPGATRKMWEDIPDSLLSSLLETLSLMLGINYWKMFCSSQIVIEGFSLAPAQAKFWNELYVKGLGEFFYRSQIDFRGLVSFPSRPSWLRRKSPVRFPRSSRLLLLNGGGKDSIVSAEFLKSRGFEIGLFALEPIRVQTDVAREIGRPMIVARRYSDPRRPQTMRDGKIATGYPSICTATFLAVLAAALFDYRYVVLSNESSADIGNLDYLGLNVNHQWSKSSESESLIREYLRHFVSPDIVQFSLVRQFSELEMVRRFASYPQYFKVFSSCNMNFLRRSPNSATAREGHAYWCNECPKCAFIFASMAAFVPRSTVIDVFGSDLFANRTLIPLYRRLLGIEGFKPFDCVGTPEEMMVALYHAKQTHSYDGEPIMDFFSEYLSSRTDSIEDMERHVFSKQGEAMIPTELQTTLNE